MKEHPLPVSTDMVRAYLDGRKTQTRRVVTSHTSIVGVGTVDWDNFCWDGSAIYKWDCHCPDCHQKHEQKAPTPFVDGEPAMGEYLHVPFNWADQQQIFRIYPRYEVGDKLWVRETWAIKDCGNKVTLSKETWPNGFPVNRVQYVATDQAPIPPELADDNQTPYWWNKRPSIHMPRWASRITLEITGIRVERLQGITWDDTHKEGILRFDRDNPDPSNGGGMGYNRGATGLPERYESITAFKDLWDSLNAKRGYGWESNPWVWVIETGILGVRI